MRIPISSTSRAQRRFARQAVSRSGEDFHRKSTPSRIDVDTLPSDGADSGSLDGHVLRVRNTRVTSL